MFPKKFSLLLIFSIILTLGLSISLGSLLAAWTSPTSTPPGSNIATPINTSSTGQAKQSGLILNTGIDVNGLIVQFGNVGIGTTSPAYKFDVNGDLRVGVAGATANSLYVNSNTGNVGIGTVNPTVKLDVAGNFNASNINTPGNITVTGNVSAAAPTAANHLTTKSYVDNAVAAAGGGGTGTYMMGNSSQIYGYFAKYWCETQFVGYHLCNVEEFRIRKLDPTYFVYNSNVVLGGWVRTGKSTVANVEGADCNDYKLETYAAPGHYGTIVKWTNNGFVYQTVDCFTSSYPPLCCSN